VELFSDMTKNLFIKPNCYNFHNIGSIAYSYSSAQEAEQERDVQITIQYCAQ